MALIAVQTASVPALADVVFVACNGGGDTVRVAGTSFLLVRNGSGAPITVTVAVPGTINGQNVPDIPVAIAAGKTACIPLKTAYIDRSDGAVHLTYSGVTTLTIAAVRL